MKIKQPVLIASTAHPDNRGSFHEIYKREQSATHGNILQQNVSINKKNVFRGMHYQYKHPQEKLVTVLNGSVIDFVIDLRRNSINYGKVQDFRLDAEDKLSLWIPAQFAHGFLSLKPDTIFVYNVFTNPRFKNDEISLNPFAFPHLQLFLNAGEEIIMSDKDRNGLLLSEAPTYAK